ncbi:putative metal-dependent phosphoesterase, PHP family [Caldisphaera lagunensis DSM 15908]|uniref:Putative metal-dependent phosphoesterase, PHP family n=1 Tax=Caldisphaera lagunensis (strain DSM 15908 / JCM 11604 / ANMR 0165 / IC-154) TaxID=1056495 RepID=L0AAT6_CALLD|nr:putative metal-dependent phosphoesterase, PHP family [Caldisphaera lagunensis DSM 15908]
MLKTLPCLAELHSHSLVSDGKSTPEEIILRAVYLGLSAIAVSDHNTFRGSAIAIESAKKLDLNITVIPANEVRTIKGDVLVLCEKIPYEEPPREPPLLHDWASINNCITIAAHPFHVGRKSIGGYLKKYPNYFDAIEVWNPRGIPFLNKPAMKLAEKFSKPKTSGSDAHIIQELGTSPTRLDTTDCDVYNIINSIRKGKCSPTINYMKISTIFNVLKWSINRRIKKNNSALY